MSFQRSFARQKNFEGCSPQETRADEGTKSRTGERFNAGAHGRPSFDKDTDFRRGNSTFKAGRPSGADRLKACGVLLLAFLVFLGIGFWVNRGIRIEGLYMDDLYMWSCYGEQSFMEFVFPIGTSSRFRPVYWMAAYLQMMVIQTHVDWFVPMNIVLNAGVALTIFAFARKLSSCVWFSGFLGGLYLVSHFAYYQIGQALGLLETQALWMALLVLWWLYNCLQARRGSRAFVRWFCLANLMYFLLAFTHERYLALMPLFYLALLFAQGDEAEKKVPAAHLARPVRLALWLLPLLNFALIFLIRRLAIGAAIPAGTGGTEVTETFSLGQALRFALDQVAYVFGVNIGPEYLSGKPWAEAAGWVHGLVYASWIPLALLCVSFLCVSLRNGGRVCRNRRWVGSNLLFLGFIALCIGCSSVTIRVELRWVYVSYAGALLYLAYMAGTVAGQAGGSETLSAHVRQTLSADDGVRAGKILFAENGAHEGQHSRHSRRSRRNVARQSRTAVQAGLLLLLMLYAACILPAELYYRSYYPNIYFWENQDRMNSLAEQTVGEYGVDGVLGKQVYILGNSYEMTDFYARTFFKVYDPERTGQGTAIHFIDSAAELPEDAGAENALVLKEVPEARGYQDITQEALQVGR